jgi:hypothetical protein
MRLLGFCCLCVASALLAGCGGASGFAPVSGTVTMDGAPLEGASVSFQPKHVEGGKEAEGSYGKTDAQGKYTLKRVSDDASGAAVGDHDVTITKNASSNPADDAAPVIEQVPPAAQKHTFTVPEGGSDKADFALKSK